MKLRIVSDLHLEVQGREEPERFDLPPHGDDRDTVLVLAGDIDVDKHACRFALRYAQQFRAVVQVLGNHEYYKGGSPQRLPEKLQSQMEEARAQNVHVLEDRAVDVGTCRFIGATLWTDFNDGDEVAMMAARHGMNDFRRIRCGTRSAPYMRRFLPHHAFALHRASLRFIEREVVMAREAGQSPVVVSHHAPYVSGGTAQSQLAFSYGSDLSSLIQSTRPALWIHGHTHDCADFVLGQTRVVSNPRGYAGIEPVEGFDPDLSVDVSNGRK